MKAPEISIIIVTFNAANYLKSLLESIFAQSPQDCEIIIIDNGSKDATASFIKDNYPAVGLLENRSNLGAAQARNQGIDIAKGDWVLTLDCDCILGNNFINNIREYLKGIPDNVGILQPKILYSNSKIIYSCGIYLSRVMRRFFDIGAGMADNERLGFKKEIFGACSAAALYRKKMLEAVREETGYFDQRFFFLVEDVDLAWRAQKKGYKAFYVPEAVCYHLGGSSKINNKLRQYLCFRNRYYMIMKNEGLLKYSMKILPILFYDLPRAAYLFLMNPFMIRGFRNV